MDSFTQFTQRISEAKTGGKNTHMTHIEDQVLYGGVNGARSAINALRAMRDMLKGSAKKGTDVTVKFDGAPAVFCGIDPSDGEFFVAKKGIFNKNPKVYKSHADIDDDTSGDLNLKLKVAFDELQHIGIKGVIQGDIMFSGGDQRLTKIDGEKYVTFHPNTIVYAVPAKSDLGKHIAGANLGVVFHTTYTGNSFEEMKASYGVDISSYKKRKSIWFQDASVHDISGMATMTADETEAVTDALARAGKIFHKIASSTLKDIESIPELAQNIETFNNSYVRKGESIGNTSAHVENMIKWYNVKFDKEVAKRKSEKGKAAQETKRAEKLAFFSKSNKKSLAMVFELQKAIVDAKLLIIRKLDSIKSISTFIKTKDGFKVTGSEGFVAIDHTSDGAVKLVDRLQFSHANFNPDVIKGWEK